MDFTPHDFHLLLVTCVVLCDRRSLAGSPVVPEPSGRVRVLSGGRQLQVAVADRSDAASYTCIASNVAGSATKEYSLQVYSKCQENSDHGSPVLQ